MDGIWDPPYYQATEETMSFCLPDDVIEETNINEKWCIQVLEILISKANTDIVEHEDELMDLLSQLACTDEVFSNMFSMSLRAKINFLDSSIRKLKDDAENFLSTSLEPAESIYDILKSLFCHYLQKKDLQFADKTDTASSSFCQFADTQKKQIASSSNANQVEKIKTVDTIAVAKQTISPTIIKVKEEDTVYPNATHVPKYPPQSFCWGFTKTTDRQVSKFQLKSPITMTKGIVHNGKFRSNSICSKPYLEIQEKRKHPLKIIKSQKHDEITSLANVPYVEPSEETNAMSLSTVPYADSSEELEFPPGYPNPQTHQNQTVSRDWTPYSTRTYTRRKKPDSPLQTLSNPPCLALVVANLHPVKAETYGNMYAEDYYTVSDLRAIARQKKLKGYSKCRKAELATLLGIKFIEGKRKQPKRKETRLDPMIKSEP